MLSVVSVAEGQTCCNEAGSHRSVKKTEIPVQTPEYNLRCYLLGLRTGVLLAGLQSDAWPDAKTPQAASNGEGRVASRKPKQVSTGKAKHTSVHEMSLPIRLLKVCHGLPLEVGVASLQRRG